MDSTPLSGIFIPLKTADLITLCIKCVGIKFSHKLHFTIYDKMSLYY